MDAFNSYQLLILISFLLHALFYSTAVNVIGNKHFAAFMSDFKAINRPRNTQITPDIHGNAHWCVGKHGDSLNGLLQIQLKSILLLSLEIPKLFENWFQSRHLNILKPCHHSHLYGKSWRPVSEELIKDSLESILDSNNHPMLIVCASGIHETGIVLGCLRRVQGWNLNSVLAEYRAYGALKSRYENEQLIELMDLDLITAPSEMPDWIAQIDD